MSLIHRNLKERNYYFFHSELQEMCLQGTRGQVGKRTNRYALRYWLTLTLSTMYSVSPRQGRIPFFC